MEEDRGDNPGVIDTGLPRVQTSDDLPRWLLVLGLVAGLTLFVALLRYAIDLLGVVFLIIMVGFSIRALSDWLTEGESVSGWALAAVSGGLIGTLTIALWLFGSHDRTVSALERRVPGALLTGVEWLEDHGWGRRVLLSGGGIGAPAPSVPQPAAATGDAPSPGSGPTAPPSAAVSGESGSHGEGSSAERRTSGADSSPGTAEASTLKASGRRGRAPNAPAGAPAAQPAISSAESPAPSPVEAAPVATSVTLTSSQRSALVGTGIRLTAVVSAAGASGAPVGTVVFLRGTSTLGTVAVRASANGTAVATFTTLTLPIGTHELMAEFHGALGFADSRSASFDQIVRRH